MNIGRLWAIELMFALFCCSLFSSCASTQNHAAKLGLCTGPPSRQLQADFGGGFLGKWSGKWDDTWQIQLTVAPGSAPDNFSLEISWEEIVGKPMQVRTLIACLRDDVIISDNGILRMKLNSNEKDFATLRGEFRKPRTAKLVRTQ